MRWDVSRLSTQTDGSEGCDYSPVGISIVDTAANIGGPAIVVVPGTCCGSQRCSTVLATCRDVGATSPSERT